MSLKSILGTVSPLYGAMNGQGVFGEVAGTAEKRRKDEADEAASQKEIAKNKIAYAMTAAGGNRTPGMKKGGTVKKAVKPAKKVVKRNSSSSASKRADGIATKGKTRGTMVTMYGGGKC